MTSRVEAVDPNADTVEDSMIGLVNASADTQECPPRLLLHVPADTPEALVQFLPDGPIVLLADDSCIMGRSETAGIRMNDVRASREHALLYLNPYENDQEPEFRVRNISKKKVIYLNGNKIKPDKAGTLTPESFLRIEQFNFRVEIIPGDEVSSTFEIEFVKNANPELYPGTKQNGHGAPQGTPSNPMVMVQQHVYGGNGHSNVPQNPYPMGVSMASPPPTYSSLPPDAGYQSHPHPYGYPPIVGVASGMQALTLTNAPVTVHQPASPKRHHRRSYGNSPAHKPRGDSSGHRLREANGRNRSDDSGRPRHRKSSNGEHRKRRTRSPAENDERIEKNGSQLCTMTPMQESSVGANSTVLTSKDVSKESFSASIPNNRDDRPTTARPGGVNRGMDTSCESSSFPVEENGKESHSPVEVDDSSFLPSNRGYIVSTDV